MIEQREIEHQELFFLGSDPLLPIPIHIPSALGRLPYFVYVRVPRAVTGLLSAVTIHVSVGGLRPDELEFISAAGAPGAEMVESSDNLVWVCLGVAEVSRGSGTLQFIGWPASAPVDMLLCTWPRFVQDGSADAWIAAQEDPHWAPSGVPLGGIGGGRVDLCRDGRFRNFTMNNNQDSPLEYPDGLPGAFLAVAEGDCIVDIATRAVVPGHIACAKLDYQARFPQAILAATVLPELQVIVTASGTLCPHDLRRSSIPGVLVRFRVENTSNVARTVRCIWGWPNIVGIGGGVAGLESSIGYGDGSYCSWDDAAGREITTEVTGDVTCLHFTGTPAATHRASAGEMLLGIRGGEVTTEIGDGHGELAVTLQVSAKGSAEATMALAVAMPQWIDTFGNDCGHAWQQHFADGQAILNTLLGEAEAILTEAGALKAHLDDSTLPEWMRTRLSNCNYPLVSNSVWYRDGRFSINEGPTEMAGCYGTIDQRLAAHPATQLLFPQLNARELNEFAALQSPLGGIQHDLGNGHLERGVGEMTWPDLTCSFILQTARHAWSTGDAEFNATMWPRAKRALQRHAIWAEEGDGVAQVGNKLGTSYDGYHYYGTTGYMATLWLMALALCEKWAEREGDSELLPEIARWRSAAVARLEADLWNGSFYRAYASPTGPVRDTCHAGQLAGQVFTRLFCGKDVLDPARLASCLTQIVALNGSSQFVMPPDEADTDGGEGSDFCWAPYVEGFMITAAATQDDDRFLPIWERMVRNMDNNSATPCDTRLMYLPKSGAASWGAYYMTAPASWLVYDAMLDFVFEAGTGVLRLNTTRPGRYPLIHPNCWLTADVSTEGKVTLKVSRVFGKPPVLRVLEAFAGTSVLSNGKELPVTGEQGRYSWHSLEKAIELTEGMQVQWQVR